MLISPEVDLCLDDRSITRNADRDILPWNIPTSSSLHGLDARSPWVSPVYADLTSFPPTMLSWGGEMFRDSIRRFDDRLTAASSPLAGPSSPSPGRSSPTGGIRTELADAREPTLGSGGPPRDTDRAPRIFAPHHRRQV